MRTKVDDIASTNSDDNGLESPIEIDIPVVGRPD